jgi:hypothetical protein
MKNSILIVFFLLVCNLFFAQENKTIQDDSSIEGQPFKLVNEFYIHGDSKIIGNNILSVNETQAFNDLEANNDDLEMLYVDIDNNPETFSSSTATLDLPDDFEKISYAGLYWSATYPYNTGTRHKNYNDYVYKGDDKRDKHVEKIKFKTPNGEYQDITGEIVYDGLKTPTHAINAPYVCYAEVTDILKNADKVKGNYTIANVKAANGYISGGSAAGWVLYVIYKAPTENAKYITTYNGFALVSKNAVDIKYKNFKSIDQGYVKTDLFLSSLEGDVSLLLDEFSIIKADKTFLPLLNNARKKYNFFNSSITKYDSIITNRVPSSKNTLGFDIARIKIPNYKNSIISNDINTTTLRFKTKSDRYYLFFTAFQTEISQTPFKEEKEVVLIPVTTKKQTKLKKVSKSRVSSSFKGKSNNRKIVDSNVLEVKGFDSDEFKNLVNQKSRQISSLKSGYYVITNVFEDAMSAGKWEATLITKGYNPKTFIDPKDNRRNVYILQTESAKEAFTKQQDIIQDPQYRATWVLKVNLD